MNTTIMQLTDSTKNDAQRDGAVRTTTTGAAQVSASARHHNGVAVGLDRSLSSMQARVTRTAWCSWLVDNEETSHVVWT